MNAGKKPGMLFGITGLFLFVYLFIYFTVAAVTRQQ